MPRGDDDDSFLAPPVIQLGGDDDELKEKIAHLEREKHLLLAHVLKNSVTKLPASCATFDDLKLDVLDAEIVVDTVRAGKPLSEEQLEPALAAVGGPTAALPRISSSSDDAVDGVTAFEALLACTRVQKLGPDALALVRDVVRPQLGVTKTRERALTKVLQPEGVWGQAEEYLTAQVQLELLMRNGVDQFDSHPEFAAWHRRHLSLARALLLADATGGADGQEDGGGHATRKVAVGASLGGSVTVAHAVAAVNEALDACSPLLPLIAAASEGCGTSGGFAATAYHSVLGRALRELAAPLAASRAGGAAGRVQAAAYPVNVRVYEALLQAQVDDTWEAPDADAEGDDDDDGKRLPLHPKADEIVALLHVMRAPLGITDRAHALASVRALFHTYSKTQCVPLLFRIRTALQAVPAEGGDNAEPEWVSWYVTSVRLGIGEFVENVVADYRRFCTDAEALGPLCQIAAFLQGGGSKAHTQQVRALVRRAGQAQAARLLADVPDTLVPRDIPELVKIFLADVDIEAREFAPVIAKIPGIPRGCSVEELVAPLLKRVKACLHAVRKVDLHVLRALTSLTKLEVGLKAHGAFEQDGLGVMGEVATALSRWPADQEMQLSELLDRAVAVDTWAPLGTAALYSSSAHDLMDMIAATAVPFGEADFPGLHRLLRQYMESVKNLVVKYCSNLLRRAGAPPRPPLPKVIHKARMPGFIAKRRASTAAGQAAAVESRWGSMEEEARLRAQRNPHLYIFLGNMEFCRQQVEKLAQELSDVATRPGILSPVVTGGGYVGGDLSLAELLNELERDVEIQRGAMVEYICDKVLLFDMYDVVVDGLYKPTVDARRLGPILAARMDPVLAEVYKFVPQDIADVVAEGFLVAFAKVLERAIFHGGEDRITTADDADTIMEDVVAVQDFFREGLDPDRVAKAFRWLQTLVGTVLAVPSEELAREYDEAPASHPTVPMTKYYIFRVLSKRPEKDKVAHKFMQRFMKDKGLRDSIRELTNKAEAAMVK